jgi:hypothetical protein
MVLRELCTSFARALPSSRQGRYSQRSRSKAAESAKKRPDNALCCESRSLPSQHSFECVRWAISELLRQSFHEWAGPSTAQSVWARACCQRTRERGIEHPAADKSLQRKSPDAGMVPSGHAPHFSLAGSIEVRFYDAERFLQSQLTKNSLTVTRNFSSLRSWEKRLAITRSTWNKLGIFRVRALASGIDPPHAGVPLPVCHFHA